MSPVTQGLYIGKVVHKRLTPTTHGFSYNVFSCLFDVARIEEMAETSKFFSYNRFNLFSLHDKDHTDGLLISEKLNEIARESGMSDQVTRFFMLCYPRILGYAFNPLTVYYGIDADNKVRLMIYEVRNTFGEQHRYVIPASENEDGAIYQTCDKEFYVSPYNSVEGHYSFHATKPTDMITVGVALRTSQGPLMKAHFHGTREPLSDRSLLAALWKTGWLSAKVLGGIHWEALKLWMKGLRFRDKPAARSATITFHENDNRNQLSA